MNLTKPVVFILGLLIGYEIRDLRRFIPFAVNAYNDIRAFVNGEYTIVDMTTDDEGVEGGDDDA